MRATAFGLAAAAALAACARRPPPDAPPIVPREPRVSPVPAPDAARGEFAAPGDARSPPLPPEPRPVSPQLSPSPLALPPAPELDAATRACVDRALARAGLDAWGDPAGTPPVRIRGDAARYARVFALHPEIRTRCTAPRVGPTGGP